MFLLSLLRLETTMPVPLLSGIPMLKHESWHLDSALRFLPFLLSHSRPSCSICFSLFNGLTLDRWLCEGTSSEVLMGQTHDDQFNKQTDSGGGDMRSWSKVRITGKPQRSLQGRSSSSWRIITPEICFDQQLVHSVSSSAGDRELSAAL